MKNILFGVLLAVVNISAMAAPGQYQINQACLDVGCFSGDNPATKTVEISQNAGTFVLTSDITFTDSDNGIPAILVNHATNRSAVVIDLNGYQIRHNGIATSATHGIVIQGQNSVVTVKNGKIAAFYDGIRAEGGATLIAENLVLRINRDDAISAGIGIIRDSVFDANEYGVNALNSGGGVAGDRLFLDSNLFIDDTAQQDPAYGFANSNYCKDNVIAYNEANYFHACTLSGDNLCDNAICGANLNAHESKD